MKLVESERSDQGRQLARKSRKRGRPVMAWLSCEEAAERLDWDAGALRRLLAHTKGGILPGASQEPDGSWSIPESAVRRITGAGLRLFSIRTLANLIDCSAESLRRMAREGTLASKDIEGVGIRVPWREYQRLIGGSEKL